MFVRIALLTHTWTSYSHFYFWFSFSFYIGFLLIYQVNCSYSFSLLTLSFISTGSILFYFTLSWNVSNPLLYRYFVFFLIFCPTSHPFPCSLAFLFPSYSLLSISVSIILSLALFTSIFSNLILSFFHLVLVLLLVLVHLLILTACPGIPVFLIQFLRFSQGDVLSSSCMVADHFSPFREWNARDIRTTGNNIANCIASLSHSLFLSIQRSIYLSIYLSMYSSNYLFIYQSIYPSIYLSLYLSICLSIHLSIYYPTFLFSCSSVLPLYSPANLLPCFHHALIYLYIYLFI